MKRDHSKSNKEKKLIMKVFNLVVSKDKACLEMIDSYATIVAADNGEFQSQDACEDLLE